MNGYSNTSLTVKGLSVAERRHWKNLLVQALDEAGTGLFDGCIDGGWMSDEIEYSIGVIKEEQGGYRASGTCHYDEMINPGCSDLIRGYPRSADFMLGWERGSEEVDFEITGCHDDELPDEDERDWGREEWDYMNSPF